MEEMLTKLNYIKALTKRPLTVDQIKMVKANYYAKNETITATKLAQLMGWNNHGSANLHYGKLARSISESIGYDNPEAEYLYTIVTFEKPGNEWYWILRKEFIDALFDLGIVEQKKEYEDEDDISGEEYYEGAKKRICVNIYERDKNAREKCIEHYGNRCFVCGFNYKEKYGEIASKFINVHHVRPLSEIKETYRVDPIKDLIPLCANCHAVVHLVNPPLKIEELIQIINIQKDA